MPETDYVLQIRKIVGNELLVLPAVIGIVNDSDGKILLGKRVDENLWLLPGGSIEPLESPADALVREMFEETGLLVKPKRVSGVYGGLECFVTYRNSDRVSYVLIVFECNIVEGDLLPDGKEFVELNFFSLVETNGPNLTKWVRHVLGRARTGKNSVDFSHPTWSPTKKAKT